MSTERKQILILGGTVYLSKEIARQALSRGHAVTIAARGESGEPPQDATFIRIDRSTPDGVAPLRGRSFDAVIDVARLPAHVGPVLDALADTAGHWTFVSSISAYADHGSTGFELHDPAPEDADDPAVERYGASKVACERLVRDRLGDRAFLPRPGLVVGPHDPMDRFGYWPLRLAEGGEVLAPGRPERAVQWIDVGDLAAWILDAGDRGVTGAYDAIGEPVAAAGFLDVIAQTLAEEGLAGEEPRLTWVPQEFLLEHGVNPWAGPTSLGLWVPEPDYDGLVRDAGPAVEAGLRPSALSETVKRWWAANAAGLRLSAGMSRAEEGAVLGAWHDRTRSFTVPRA